MIIICLYPVLLLSYGSLVFHKMKPMIMTILVGWLITRYCDGQNTYYRIDVITIHFVVYQLIYLMCKWEAYELEWPFFILQQASCCIYSCITAFLSHELMLRYFPFQFKIIFLWICSLYDM
jgi:hypothetical protein